MRNREEILVELERLARQNEAMDAQSALDDFEVVEEDDLEVDDGVSDAPLVRLVNSIVMQAATDGASDIHFEPQEDSPARPGPRRRRAQRDPADPEADGERRHDPPEGAGEARHRRAAQAAGRPHRAERARRRPHARYPRRRAADGRRRAGRDAPHRQVAQDADARVARDVRVDAGEGGGDHPPADGALLVTGPTGSGKSTTLYAALAEINRPEINIITVEDPVEYRLAGINQVQINVKADMTFASALRSILRSDPDAIMVGEIRDAETAKMAIESALTGHMVFSTLHTNDAPGAMTRLNEMGVEPFLTGSAVSAVIAQRLARKLCTNCCEMYSPTAAELIAARISPDMAAAREGMVLYRKVGCPRCGRTGYKGRIGIFQLLLMNDELEALVSQNASRDAIEQAGAAAGMRSLWDDGIAKAAAGLTSLEELARIVTST